MNEWVRRSIELANGEGYLDKLSKVYPVTAELERAIPNEIKLQIKTAFDTRDRPGLIKTLLELDKFPIKDPYVAFLRKREQFLAYNPRTVDRIAERLFSTSFDEIIKGCEEPKEFNRQIGTLFKGWLPKLGYPFLSESKFGAYRGIAFLKGSDSELMDYANRVLGCNLDKGPDLLVKVGNSHIIGEAKFLTDYGGHQNAQFEDALRLLKSKKGNAIKIAVLDGVVWIEGRAKMYRKICRLNKIALSALLLDKFLESLR
jgi:hypothetical protein